MTLHGFILEIIYTMVFPAKRLNNIPLRIRLFNRLTHTQKTVEQIRLR